MVKGYDNDLDVAVLAVPLADISDETKAAIAVARLGDSKLIVIVLIPTTSPEALISTPPEQPGFINAVV